VQLIFLLIISLALAVIVYYSASLLLQVRRTLAGVQNFTAMLDSSLGPLLQGLKVLSARINSVSARADQWKHSVVALKKSVHQIVVAAEAIGAIIALRKIAASGQSKPRMMVSALDFLRRR